VTACDRRSYPADVIEPCTCSGRHHAANLRAMQDVLDRVNAAAPEPAHVPGRAFAVAALIERGLIERVDAHLYRRPT
jgi:hypothetical protein